MKHSFEEDFPFKWGGIWSSRVYMHFVTSQNDRLLKSLKMMFDDFVTFVTSIC